MHVGNRRRRHGFGQQHARIARQPRRNCRLRFAIGLCLGRTAELDTHRDVARHALNGVRQIEHALDRIETADIPDPDVLPRAAARPRSDRFADAEAVDNHFRWRSAVRDHDVRGLLRQDHEFVDGVEHGALPKAVAFDQIGHRHCGSDRSRQRPCEGPQARPARPRAHARLQDPLRDVPARIRRIVLRRRGRRRSSAPATSACPADTETPGCSNGSSR